MYLTWFDNNSWLIEWEGQRILLDPWLVGPLAFPNLGWLFRGVQMVPRPIPDQIDLILLSQGLADHAHPETLRAIARDVPIVASPNAAKVARAFGFQQVTPLAHGESFVLGDRLTIEAVPGSAIGPFLVENGYLLTGLMSQLRLYYEPHGNHAPQLQHQAPVDIVVTPVVNLELPFGPILPGQDRLVDVAQWLRPKLIVPTAAGQEVQFEGLLTKVLREVGSPEQARALLAQHQLPTSILTPRPGDRLEITASVWAR